MSYPSIANRHGRTRSLFPHDEGMFDIPSWARPFARFGRELLGEREDLGRGEGPIDKRPVGSSAIELIEKIPNAQVHGHGAGVIYDIRHVTTYAFEKPVNLARISMRLEPKDGNGQKLISHAVNIRPRPSDRSGRRDFFGTHIEIVVIETAHRSVRIESRARVLVSRQSPARTALSSTWETVRDLALDATSLGPESPVGYVYASPLVPVQPAITAYASASFPPSMGVLVGAVDFMRRIRAEFKYNPKATSVSTPLREIFDKRHGVAQDFAHVMIAGLRGLGLPAAYVSGYLHSIRPHGKARSDDAGAMHAWVLLWCGDELGWIGFDPTNDLLVENDHIIVAVGRDFADVSPVDGVIVGSRKQKLSVAVEVVPVESV
jgi:transglutaminase-like putative cysteine protease